MNAHWPFVRRGCSLIWSFAVAMPLYGQLTPLQPSPLQMQVREISRRAPRNSEFSESRGLAITLRNLTPQEIADVRVRWGVVLKIYQSVDRYRYRVYNAITFGDEFAVVLKPLETKILETDRIATSSDRSPCGLMLTYRDKAIGRAVRVSVAGRVVVEEVLPPGFRQSFEHMLPVQKKNDNEPLPESLQMASAGAGEKTPLQLKPVRFWPPSTGTLTGKMEVNVKNPNPFEVKVALRTGGKGVDFSVPPQGQFAVKVPNGNYETYYEFSSKPGAVFQGSSFALQGTKGVTQRIEIEIGEVVVSELPRGNPVGR